MEVTIPHMDPKLMPAQRATRVDPMVTLRDS
jgi:hypothetical protein